MINKSLKDWLVFALVLIFAYGDSFNLCKQINDNVMKKILCTITFAFLFLYSFPQVTAFYGKLRFEPYDSFNLSENDTLIHYWQDMKAAGIWEVKIPDGNFFNESQKYSDLGDINFIGGEYAILTNKSILIKEIDTTTLYIKFKDDKQLHNDSIASGGTISFFYKLDADSTERLNYYMSIDNGKTWKKVFDSIDQSISFCRVKGQMLSTAPSTGREVGWIEMRIANFSYAEKVFYETPTIGSIIYKFEFIANKNSPTEGVMFDEFRLFYRAVDVPGNTNSRLYIVKTNNYKQGIYMDKELNKYSLTVYNLQGQIIGKIQKLDTGLIDLTSLSDYNGILFLSFTDKSTGNIITKKIIN
jgi:hypothetical protein